VSSRAVRSCTSHARGQGGRAEGPHPSKGTGAVERVRTVERRHMLSPPQRLEANGALPAFTRCGHQDMRRESVPLVVTGARFNGRRSEAPICLSPQVLFRSRSRS